MAKERLQKLLAQANIASRRASEDLITAGRVRVNGEVVKLGDKADPATDVIEVDGARLSFDAIKPIYIMLNKPKHVLTTDKPHRTDQRQTVMDLIGRKEHLFSIGRLDADSEGLIVMTNDGDLAQMLSHPSYRHSKTYRVEVLGLPTAETLEKWQQGIFLDDGKTAPCLVEITHGSVKGSTLRIIMTEGKKRQIRRVAGALGHPVRRLVRTHLGMLALGDLEPGKWRELTPREVIALSTPAPEIKQLRAQPPRRAAAEPAAPPSEDKPAPSRQPRDKKPVASGADDDQRKRRPVRRQTPDSDDARRGKPGAPRSRNPRSRKPEDHDDKWGKPTPGGRKPGRPAKRPPNREPRDRKDRRS